MDINLLATRQMDRNQHKQMLVENLGIFELRALGREVGEIGRASCRERV